MTEQQIKKNVKQFVDEWKGRGYEKGESQPFWIALLRKVLGVEEPEQFIIFEKQVHLDHTSFIDGMIPSTHVMIEQKSANKDLNAAIKQSDGSMLSPFEQAKRYSAELPYSKRPRYIVTCNFREFYIYDMEKPQGEPEKLLLQDLPKEYYRLKFLVDVEKQNIKREVEISKQAGELIGEIYDSFASLYHNMEEAEMQSLNVLCVRFVFCMYAEDAGVFNHKQFQEYVQSYSAENLKAGLLELFRVLDTKIEDRDPYIAPKLAAFPYVNGGLFANENIIMPQLNDKIKAKLVEACEFDWSPISPTIFGAVFESTLNPETRRKGGMHYTSIANIHKVIDPLFLDDLTKELQEILALSNNRQRKEKLTSYQNKLASLKFLDPACGSGNFLTETYICLRRLENEVLKAMQGNQIVLGELADPIKVKISQFYGIEINDFAVTVAKTALWIAENQMMQETKAVVTFEDDFLPLKTNAYIVEGNALRIDWNTVVTASELHYIMGNPPFVGTKLQSISQKEDMKYVFTNNDRYKKLDYVSAWFKKTCDYIGNNKIRIALVSTNSIVQGEMVDILWKQLLNDYGVKINFAYRTFRWDSESNLMAHVHCVIIGFAKFMFMKSCCVYDGNSKMFCENINAYLMTAPSIFVVKTQKSLCGLPPMIKGSQLIDDGNFVLQNSAEYREFVEREPKAKEFILRYYNAHNLINSDEQMYALYLDNCSVNCLRKMPLVLERVEKVKQFREQSKAKSVYAIKDTPTKYFITSIPKKKCIVVPIVSSEKRKYIPMCFADGNVVITNASNYIETDSLYMFGMLMSNVHNAWTRSFAGRLKSDYRYSKDLIYNTFPWPNPNAEQKTKIEQTAQGILDARSLYPDSSLADLYDELTMPSELRKAHQINDKAVMEAYGFDWRNMTESQCVAELMKMYQKLVNKD